MATDFCGWCWPEGCDGGCADDPGERVCSFCGEYQCDGSGYNCPDEVYATYNEGHIDVEID